MAAEETMGSPPPRESAPAATARGDVSAAVVGAKPNTSRVSVLKRMMDNDDDDDSSSDDDEMPKKAVATSAEGKEVKGSDAVVQETHSKQKSRSHGETKQKAEKRAKKEKQPKKEKRAEKREGDEKKESGKKKEVVISELSAGIKVRSERLQMRAAIMESTTNVAVVTPDEKAKARKKEDAKKKDPKKDEVSTPPRKRRRVNSGDSVVQEVEKNAHGKKDDAETSALKRLTRKESREALKKQHDHEREETTKTSEKVATTTAEVLKEDVATLAESVSTITKPKKGPNVATSDDDEKKKTVTTKSTDEDVGSTRPHKPRSLKRSRDERDAVATQALQEGITKENQSQLKRRSKVVSDESDTSEQEDRTTGDKPRKADHRRDTHSTKERSSAKINGEEANEKKRKRLKRPLSPASSNGTKSGSRTALPDRDDSEGATTYSVRASSKGRSDHGKPSTSHDKRERKKHPREDVQLERGEKRKMEAHQEPKSTVERDDRGREDRKAGKHRLSRDNDERMKSRLKKERIAALGATTLNDFIEHEKRESRKHGKDMERGSEGGRFTQGESETASADKETLYSGFTESEGRGARESDHPKEEAAGEPEPQNETPGSMNEGSKAIKTHVHPSSPEESSMSGQAPVTSTPSSDLQVPAQITTTVATTVEEDDEEGSVSDEEKSGAGEKSGTDTASVENKVGTEQADPMSFVIPKKRPTSVVVGRSPPKRDTQVVVVQRQSGSKDSLTPTPVPSPESSVDTSISAVPGKPRLRTKNAVLPKMTPLSQQEKDFFHLARKCNSLLKAASVTRLRGSNAANPRLVSAFGCTSDRYGAMLETGKQYVELTKRMACPTRKEIKSSDHPPRFFGVVMANPPDKERDAITATSPAANEPAPSTAIPCYETLEFAKAEDRDWYLKRMYGTTFVPQLLRERVTLVMRNARYVRRSTGLLFNAQRDKEEYATQIAERYTVNRSVPRCDILQKNWQLLVNGRTTFVFLHYMNREDAMIARAQFKDDDGLSLIIKGESRASELAAANNGMRSAISPGLSPPPLSSPPQVATRRRSRSRSNGHSSPRRPDFPELRGREMDRDRGPPQRHDGRGGPWPPRDRSLDRGRGHRRGGRSSINGSDARNGSRYGPASLSRSPPRRASHSRSGSPRPPSHQDVAGRPLSPESSHQDRNLQVPTERFDECENKEDGESSSQGAEVSSQTKDTSKNGDETSGHRVDHIDDHRHLDDGRSAGQQQRVRSRSRSRPRHPDDRQPPGDRQPPSPHSGRRRSEDRSFQYDGRGSSEYYGRGGPQRRSPPPHMHMGDRDRHGHENGRYRGHEQGRYGGHDHPHAEQAFFDDRARPSRDYDRRGHQGDRFRRQHHHDERRFH